jgi:hypothetical protein
MKTNKQMMDLLLLVKLKRELKGLKTTKNIDPGKTGGYLLHEIWTMFMANYYGLILRNITEGTWIT